MGIKDLITLDNNTCLNLLPSILRMESESQAAISTITTTIGAVLWRN
jgi:hypothetical protein